MNGSYNGHSMCAPQSKFRDPDKDPIEIYLEFGGTREGFPYTEFP